MRMVSPYQTKPTLFLDMDGVLADFIGGLVEYYDVKELKARMVVHGQVEEHIGRTWDTIREDLIRVPDFFDSLPKMPYAGDLLTEVVRMSDAGMWEGGVFVATHAMRGDPACRDAKYRWLLHHAGEYFAERMVVFSGEADKKLLARPGCVLIDDYAVNTINWFERGGDAFEFVPYRADQREAAGQQHRWLIKNLLKKHKELLRQPTVLDYKIYQQKTADDPCSPSKST